jgi:hypothetical protein
VSILRTNEIRFYLHSYDGLQREIENLSKQLEEYRRMNISGIKAQVITDMPICHSNTSRTEEQALKRVEYMQDLETEIDQKMRILRAINSVYFYLSEPERSILEMRYFRIPIGKPKASWFEISEEVILSEQRCKNIDSKLVKDIQIKMYEITEKEIRTA